MGHIGFDTQIVYTTWPRATDSNAVGVGITSLPITAEKVRQALREK
jgi:hypothetical protein